MSQKVKQIVSRFEHVGSFLRPPALQQARTEFEVGRLSRAELTEVEDREIAALAAKQVEAGLAYISDGEFRRSYWHLDFFWGFYGIERLEHERGYQFHGEETRKDSARLTDRLAYNPDHPVFAEFKFLKNLGLDAEIRHSIPSPSQFFAELVRGINEEKVNEFYPDREVLYQDIARIYGETVQTLYTLGLRHLKLDDCTWGMLVDQGFWETMTGGAFNTEELQQLYLKLNNAALAGLPEDLVVSTHVCRGNYHSTWATQGGYGPVAANLFGKEAVSAFFLEFDDERSGGFEPLSQVPAGKQVVLGLITSKNGDLEDRETILHRIGEAAKYVSLENLSLSPQCGFASTEEGNILSEAAQWEKLRFIADICQEVWGDCPSLETEVVKKSQPIVYSTVGRRQLV